MLVHPAGDRGACAVGVGAIMNLVLHSEKLHDPMTI